MHRVKTGQKMVSLYVNRKEPMEMEEKNEICHTESSERVGDSR